MGLSDNLLNCNDDCSSKIIVVNDAVVSDGGQDASNIRRSSPKKKSFSRSQHHCNPRDNRRKIFGFRHQRRIENLNILLSQAEADEDESGEVDFVDLVSHHNSAFRELFVEPEKMSSWISFVNSSEEEQQHILNSAKNVKLHDIFNGLDDSDEFVTITRNEQDSDAFNQSDANSKNFAVTAHQCFQRINRNLRTYLRRNNFPSGELRHLEEELVAFFEEWPTSVYVADLPDGYRRMMLHAVSQYLDLDARSFDAPGSVTGRQTQVENNQKQGNCFVPPPTPLASYIIDNKSVCLVQA